MSWMTERRLLRLRERCGARRRSDGQPCQAPCVPGKKRCKWHGGCSTGPRTEEGKERALANLRQFQEANPPQQADADPQG